MRRAMLDYPDACGMKLHSIWKAHFFLFYCKVLIFCCDSCAGTAPWTIHMGRHLAASKSHVSFDSEFYIMAASVRTNSSLCFDRCEALDYLCEVAVDMKRLGISPVGEDQPPADGYF